MFLAVLKGVLMGVLGVIFALAAYIVTMHLEHARLHGMSEDVELYSFYQTWIIVAFGLYCFIVVLASIPPQQAKGK